MEGGEQYRPRGNRTVTKRGGERVKVSMKKGHAECDEGACEEEGVWVDEDGEEGS
jgi:hypothetical protein